MSISGGAWASDLYGRLSGAGFTGTELSTFTSAVGMGSATHVVGQSFMTVDVGVVAGAGVGTGTGITGLSSGTISSSIYGLAVGYFGQAGTKLQDLCDAVAASCVAILGQASLSSIDAPVYAGTGTITPGTITVNGSTWGSLIQTQGASFMGSQWGSLASAIGMGQALDVLSSGTGTLVITGGGSGSGPGSGTGTGTIS